MEGESQKQHHSPCPHTESTVSSCSTRLADTPVSTLTVRLSRTHLQWGPQLTHRQLLTRHSRFCFSCYTFCLGLTNCFLHHEVLFITILQPFLFNLLVNFKFHTARDQEHLTASWNPASTHWVLSILVSWFAVRKTGRELVLPQGHFASEIALVKAEGLSELPLW